MRLPHSEHASRPWRIHEITADFRIEDVWALPTPGDAGDFPLLIEQFAAGDGAPGESSRATRVLFAIRWKLGELFGWDREESGAGARVPTLRDRLPADLRDGPSGPKLSTVGFKPLYLTEDEFAAEIANETMHGVLHLGWVSDGDGWRGQMAILVKPNGLMGNAYMAAIKPFRYLIVYPQMLQRIEREWPAARERQRRQQEPVS